MSKAKLYIIVQLSCLAMLVLLLLSGCKTQQPIVAVERHDSIRTDDHDHSHHQRDSIYIHDSVYIVIKGDTIHEHHWHTEYKEKAVADTIRDSINVAVHDSVPYPVEVPVYVRQRNAYDKATAKGFWILLAIIVCAVVICIGKKRCWWVKPLSWISKIL